MPKGIPKDKRPHKYSVTPIQAEASRDVMLEALNEQTVNPHELMWHYCRVAIHGADNNVSKAADIMGMHRRTLQRIMDKDRD